MGKRFDDALMKLGGHPRFLGDDEGCLAYKEVLQGAKEVLDYSYASLDYDPATACAGILLVKFGLESMLARMEMEGLNIPLLKDMVHIDIEQLYTVSKDFALASKASTEKDLGFEVGIVEREVDGVVYYSLQHEGRMLELKNHATPNFALVLGKDKQ